jgi:hypothetical protein
MNRYLLASLLAASAATANVAFADTYGEGWDPQPTFQSTRTRADVIAEMRQARTEQAAFTGEDSGSTYLSMNSPKASTTTRAAVTAEYIRSRDEVTAMDAEDSGSTLLARARMRVLTPTNVAGEAIAAQGD